MKKRKVELINPVVYGEYPFNKVYHKGKTTYNNSYSLGSGNTINSDFFDDNSVYNLQGANFSNGVFAGKDSDVYIDNNPNNKEKSNKDGLLTDQVNTNDFNGNVAIFNNINREELISQKNINGKSVTTTKRYVGTNENGEKLYEITTYTYNPKKENSENKENIKTSEETKEKELEKKDSLSKEIVEGAELNEIILPTPKVPEEKQKFKFKKFKRKEKIL